MSVLTNGWLLVLALGYAFAVFPTLTIKLAHRPAALRLACLVCLPCSAFLIAYGLALAQGWPEAQPEALSPSQHQQHRKAGLVLLVLDLWPYLVLALGAASGFLAVRGLLQAGRMRGIKTPRR